MIDDIEKFKRDPSIQFEYKYLASNNKQAAQKKYRKAISEAREEHPLPKHPRRRKRLPYLPILAGVTFAFMLASLAFIWLMISLQNPFAQVEEVPVPNLIGLRFETAVSQYSDLNVEIIQEALVFNDDFAPGVIFSQEPRVGRSIREGSSIRVMVSYGQQVVRLENFEGRPVDATTGRLTELGLEYELVPQSHSTIRAGYIIFTNPSHGAYVNSGSTVTLHVSLGPETVYGTVPDVRGMTIDRARQMLELFNMRVGDVTHEQSDMPNDTVIAQYPEENTTQVAEGTAVNLVISRGIQLQRVAIPVPLPYMNFYATVQAFQDGVLIQEEILNPSEVRIWSPIFSGTDEIYFIEILVAGHAHMQYQLNFSVNPATFHEVTRNYGGAFDDDDSFDDWNLDDDGTLLD